MNRSSFRQALRLQGKSVASGFLLGLFCVSSALFADDTEIFFGQSTDAIDSHPNVLFILDTSGSMNERDGGPTSRMERLKEAMYSLIDQSSSFNVGFMGFSGHLRGGSVRYPIGYLDGVSTNPCPEAGCPDEVVVTRPRHSNDDAVEKTNTGEVTLDSGNLFIGEFVDNSVPEIPPGYTLETGTAVMEASVEETYYYGGSASTRLAYPNTAWVTHSWSGFSDADAPLYSPSEIAYRFPGVTLPANAIVANAYIEFTNHHTFDAEGMLSQTIWGEATATPDPYFGVGTGTPPFLSTRLKTSKSASWPDIPLLGAGAKQNTPNLQAILNEIISLPGWAVGNAVSLIFESTIAAVTPNDTRTFYGNALVDENKPKLHFEYYLPPDAVTITEVADDYTYEAVKPVDNTVEVRNTNAEENLFFLHSSNDPAEIAFRFNNVGNSVPANSKIDEAYLHINTKNGNGSFNANISAELIGVPQSYATLNQRDRTSTTSFVEMPMGSNPTVSPDISAVLTEVLDLPDWNFGGSFSIQLKPGAGFENDGSDNQTISTSSEVSSLKPKLVITYSEDLSLLEPDDNLVETGIRFPNLHVPPGAIIQSATVEFHSNSADAGAADLEIRGQAIGNAPEFTATNGDISSRTKTAAGVPWIADPWNTVGNQFDTVDIKNIVQEIVSRSDWCGGNAIAIIASGTGTRDAISFDQSAINGPTLRVTYAPDSVPSGAYCSNRSAVVPISSNTDDGIELQSSSAVDLTGNSLDLNTNADGGSDLAMRFRGVPVPQGATIVSAVLELTASNNISGGISMTISSENVDDSDPLDASNGEITGRDWTSTSVDWTALPETTSGGNLFSPDITNLVSSIVSRTGWAHGNSMTLRLSAGSGDNGQTRFHSFDGDEALSPRLIIYYQGVRSTPSSLFKDNLKNAISELVAQDGTPIVDALYEGSLYMKGLPVDYGTQRGSQKWIDRNSRVSHPFSYSGGTVNRSSSCTDADLSADSCRYETITGSPTYISPMTNQCQQNHIVLLSDGEATSNSARDKVKSLIGQSNCVGSDADEKCGVELAEYLVTADHAPLLPGQQKITTHTIGFNLDEPQFLKDIADAGDGNFYPASTATDLLNAFKNIFVNVSKSDTTFVAPSASINQFNRLKHRDDIYYSLFKPESTMRWSGNIKRYKIQGNAGSTADIVDATGANAINPSTGQFKASSRSFWSNLVDGPSVTKGGAAAELPGLSARKVLTYAGTDVNLMALDNRVTTGSSTVTAADFDLPADLAADSAYVDSLIKWTAGHDVQDEDADGDQDEYRAHMGDPLHSQPVILNYGGTEANPDSVIYAATNEGYLHAFEQSSGKEHFAFIPKQLFKNLRYYFENDVTTNRRYGLDGHLTTWIQDTNNNGAIDSGTTDKAYLYITMRRGGRQIFALDVTNYNAPKYLWHIDGDTVVNDSNPTTANGDYTDIGETWSKVVKTQIMTSSGARDVIMFGGGYDGNNHDPVNGVVESIDADGNPKADFRGQTLYIADALTGELLWQAENYSDMVYSIPGNLRAIDINADGMTDQVYFGDLGGQVWRMDINNEAGSGSLNTRISAGVVADFGGNGAAERRRFFYAPDLSVVSVAGQQYLSVSIGSGWRSHPLDTDVTDRFYTFRQQDVYGPPRNGSGAITYSSISETTSGMKDVTSNIGSDASAHIGWYMDMSASGEKILSSSVTLDGQVIFTSYVPAATMDACAAAVGSGKVYAVDALNGDPVVALGETGAAESSTENLHLSHRSKVLSHAGIPPSASVLFPAVGDATVLLGTEKLGSVDIGEPKRRTFWREHVDEDS